jgi:acetyl esterase/lipase
LSPTLQSAPAKQGPRQRTRKILLGFIVLLILFMLLAHPVYTHLRAAGLLLRIQDPNQPGALSRLGAYPVEERLTTVATSSGTIPARLYTPQGADHAPGMVIVHGVHHLGIEEPRLVKFARAVSASGIKVIDPATGFARRL